MAKAKKAKTQAKNKQDDGIATEDTQSSDTANRSDAPSSVEAAYWQEKVDTTTPTAITKDGRAKDVNEYTSNIMVTAKPNESSEQLLRRFNREVRELNLIDEIRERLEYEKPSQRRKREKRERAINMKRFRSWE
jgi:ribosomal protein S21